MSLITRARAAGRHRRKTPAELRRELLTAEAQADQLACALVAEAKRSTQLERQLDEAGIELSGAREDQRAAEETAESYAAELATAGDEMRALRAQLANARTVGPLPQHTTTVPLDTRDLAGRFDPAARGSRVIHLADAVDETTQEIPRPHAA